MYVCMYVYIYIYVYMYICIYIYRGHVFILKKKVYLLMCRGHIYYIHIEVRTCLFFPSQCSCTGVTSGVYIYIYTYIYINTYIYIHIYIYTYICIYVYIYICINMYICIYHMTYFLCVGHVTCLYMGSHHLFSRELFV